MLRPYLKIWEWEWIFGCSVKAISFPGVRSPCAKSCLELILIFDVANFNPLISAGMAELGG